MSVQAQQSAPAISRRAAGAGVLSLLMMGQPMAAKAFLGIGEGNAAETEYQQLTVGSMASDSGRGAGGYAPRPVLGGGGSVSKSELPGRPPTHPHLPSLHRRA